MAIVFSGSILSAQKDSTSIASEKVEVVKRYQASILQANRKPINFQKKETTKAPIRYNYNLTGEKIIDFERPNPEIRPIGFKGNTETKEKVFNGYVYGGYGSHQTLPLGAAYHYYIEDWVDFGFSIDHFSANSNKGIIDEIGEVFNSNYRDLKSNLYLGYHLGPQTKIRLEGDLGINTRNVRLDTINLNVRKLGGDFSFDHNVFEDNGFAIRLGAGYHTAFHRADDFRDNYLKGDLNLIKQLTETLSAELPVSIVRTAINDSQSVFVTTSFLDLIFQPTVRFRGQNFNAKVGLEYITSDEGTFLFPLVDLSMDRVLSILDLRIYTESEYQRNSFYNLIDKIPYLNSRLAVYSPSYLRSYNLYPSVDYNNFTFGLNLAYRTYEDDYLPIGFGNRFEVDYIDRDEFRLTPSVSWSNKENISFNLSYDYNIFLTDLSSLSYKPTSTLSIDGEQKLLNDKLTFSQDMKLIGNRDHFETFVNDPVQLPTYVDLGLGIKYRISQNFDISVKGVNLLQNNETETLDFSQIDNSTLWFGYPILGRQFWGTIKVRF